MNMKLSAAGFAIQAAKGTAKTQPDFWGGVGGGGLVTLAAEQTEDELTSADVGGIGEFRESVAVAAGYESRAWPESIAGLLYAVLGGIASSGGAPAVPAVLTTALAGANNDLTLLAKTAGVAGNAVTIALVGPVANDQALDVTVIASAITVHLATGVAGAITSTAGQVKNAINVDTEAKALVTASVAPGNSGGGIVTALAAANLAGGAAAGGGGDYTHVITPAAVLPWVTVFGDKGMERKAASDCKLDELKVEWEGNAPIKVTTTWVGLGVAWSDVAYVPVLEESLVNYLKGINLAATIDLDGAGYDGDGHVLGGSLTVKRNIASDIYSGNLMPGDLYEGAFEADVEIKYRVPNLLPVRLLLTGAVDGAVPSGDVPYGGFTLAFSDAPDSLALAATRVAWKTDEPDADPKGGPAELTLQGRCYGVTTPLTATVVNAHPSY